MGTELLIGSMPSFYLFFYNMNTLKVGDKVKFRSDLVVWKKYRSSRWNSLEWLPEEEKYKWFETNVSYVCSDGDFKVVWWNWLYFNDAMIEPIKSSTVTSRPTYQRKAERSDGVVFEKDAIWWRSLKEIQDSIKERKDSIKADEQLLRAHRSLFSKK